jgi:hypothetical protein
MKMAIKFYGAYSAAKKSRRLANKPFKVRPINKDGTISKMALAERDYFATKEDAEKMANERMKLNPGKKYVVTED